MRICGWGGYGGWAGIVNLFLRGLKRSTEREFELILQYLGRFDWKQGYRLCQGEIIIHYRRYSFRKRNGRYRIMHPCTAATVPNSTDRNNHNLLLPHQHHLAIPGFSSNSLLRSLGSSASCFWARSWPHRGCITASLVLERIHARKKPIAEDYGRIDHGGYTPSSSGLLLIPERPQARSSGLAPVERKE